ncbi:MAG TPA: amino acid permease [Rhabdochlamydiaceae bacterium]|nr:amino acid permease [Rhabdochlamydiaceae bacterium]
MKKGMFAKKSIGALLKEAADNKHGLKRALGPMNLTAMGIGAVVGAGLFVITGEVAAKFAGPGVIFSFVIAALIAILAALCYAEFASLIPIAGSAYTYAFVTIGEFFAWIMGTALAMEYFFSFCTVAVGWSGYLNSFFSDFGFSLPSMLSQAPLHYSAETGWSQTGAVLNLPAMIIIGLIGWLVSRGIQGAAFLNDILVIVKLGVILVFIGFGLAFINADNLTPFVPENTGVFGEFGWSGVLRGAGVVFFAFLGFDAVATLAQEAKNPQRDLPIGMIGSLIICTVAYIAFGLVMTGVVNFRSLAVADPVGVAINAFGPSFTWLRYIVKFSILAGLSSVILVMMTGLSRIFYTMSHDGLMPKIFGKTHPTYRTPFYTTWINCVLAMLVAGFFPVNILGQLTSMGALFIFAMVCFGVLVLRFTQPTLHRPFKTPFTPWVPLLGTLSCILLMILMPGVTWLQFIVFTLLGCVVYYLYGRKHSKTRNP